MTTEVRVLHAGPDVVGESPLWDSSRGCLWWVDILGRRIHRLDWSSGRVHSVAVDLPPAALFLDPHGLLVAAGHGWYRLEGAALVPLASAPVAPGPWRMNDGCTDTAGRIWTGSIAEPRDSGAGGDLFRLGPLGATRVLGGLGVQNGTAVSPCGRLFYLSDSAPDNRTIWRFDLDPGTGTLSNRRVFHRCRDGRPDGGATDAAGNYWFAELDAGRVVCLDPEGIVAGTWTLPVSRPSKIAFCGPNLRTLAVTSIRAGLDAQALAAQPLAGALLALDPPGPGWALPLAQPGRRVTTATQQRPWEERPCLHDTSCSPPLRRQP